MNQPHQLEQLEEVAANNERSLNTLARAIALSQGRFSLIQVRCNYIDLQQEILQRLRQRPGVEFRELVLSESAKTLYTAIKEELGNEQPPALIVLGLEAVTALDDLLSATNQVRDEFRKSFSFPLVLWFNDEVLRKLVRLAPDFNSWTGVPIQFAIATPQLLERLRQNTQQVFAAVLDAGVGRFLPNSAILGAGHSYEFNLALTDLQSRKVKLDPELEAGVEFLLGRDCCAGDQIEAALVHYRKSLKYWQQTDHLEWRGLLLFQIGLCCLRRTEIQQTETQRDWQDAKRCFRQGIKAFESAGRWDLVAKFITQLGEVLRRLEAWEELQTLAQNSLPLHQTYGSQVQLAQDYGFLAEVALKGHGVPCPENWAEQANRYACQAVKILSEAPQDEQRQRGLYELLLAQSQQCLGQPKEAILTLETAKAQSNPQDNPQLYIDILGELRSLYFQQGEYVEAFRIKQEQRAIEAQYGFRAFIGAGRLQPKRQASSRLRQVVDSRNSTFLHQTIAPEIAASGRKLDVKRLIERMTRDDHKLTVIHGLSGVGKSSILTAGLVPALKQREIGTREVLPIVVQVYTNWVRALGQSLAEALKEKAIDLPTTPDSGRAILEQLRKNEDRHLLTVLIFDQFEEFFFADTEPAARYSFFEFLRDCMTIPYMKVILSLREDYLHYLLEYERFANGDIINNDILTKENRYHLGNFSRKDAELVIKSLTERAHFYLEPGLIDALVTELAGDLGEVRPIELQIVGAQLQTENITTLAKYREYGKEKLVEQYLEKVIEDCGLENQDAAKSVLYLLTDENGNRPLKTHAQLAAELAEEIEKLELVLEIFVTSGLVVLLPEVPADRYQLVHDYLVTFIRQQREVELTDKLKEAEQELERVEQANRVMTELIAELKKEREQRKLTEAELNRVEEANQFLAKAQQKTKRTIQRGMAGLAAISILAIAVIAGAGTTVREAQEGTKIERAGILAWRQFESTQIEALMSAISSGQDLKKLVTGEPPLEQYPATSPLFALQAILDRIHQQNRFSGAQGEVYEVSFSPDGQRLATAGEDGTIQLWNRSGRPLAQLKGHQGAVLSVSFSRNGQRLATAGQDGTARLWDLSGKQLAQLTGHQQPVTSVDFSPDGQRIATAGEDGTVRVWNLSGQELLRGKPKGATSELWDVRFSPDGQQIATAGEDGIVRLWNFSRKPPIELKGHQGAVFNVSFSRDGKQLATVGFDGMVRVWNRSGQFLREFNTNQPQVTSVSFDAKGQQLVTTGTDGTVRLWNLSGQELAQMKGDLGWVYSASFSSDGKYLATAGQDGSVKLWNLKGQQRVEWSAHKGDIWGVSFSPDGQSFVTAGLTDGIVRLWNLSGEQQVQWETNQQGIENVSFDPDGQSIATAGEDGTVQLWNLSRQRLAQFKATNQGQVYSVNFSPDRQRLATAAADGTIRLWNRLGQPLAQWKGHQGKAYTVKFSPNGQQLATAGEDGTARLWNLSGEQISRFDGHRGKVYSVNFSVDGQQLATAGEDGTAWLWNLSGKQIARFDGHQGIVYSVNFSSDGQRLATAGADRTVRLWTLSGQQIAQFDRHQGAVFSVSFSPDGQRLATVGADGMVRLRRVEELDELLVRGCDWLKDYLDTHSGKSKLCPSE